MNTRGLDWIDDLPPELAGQRALLRGLLALCDADDRISWLVIGCSLARGAGDRLSDLDMAMGIRDEDFEAARPDLRRAVDGLGEPRGKLPSPASGAGAGPRVDLRPVRRPQPGRSGALPGFGARRFGAGRGGALRSGRPARDRRGEEAGDVRRGPGVGVRGLVRAGRSGQVPAPRVDVGSPGQAERGTGPVGGSSGPSPWTCRIRSTASPASWTSRPGRFRRVSRAPWRILIPGGCWTRRGGSPRCCTKPASGCRTISAPSCPGRWPLHHRGPRADPVAPIRN